MKSVKVIMLVASVVIIIPNAGFGACLLLNLGPEQLVQAGDPCEDIVGYGSSVPTYADWNNDGKKDLIVGEGSPAKENDANLIVPTLRSSPEVLDVDRDGKKDLLTANTEGQLLFYKNTGSIVEPNFSGYLLIESKDSPVVLSSH